MKMHHLWSALAALVLVGGLVGAAACCSGGETRDDGPTEPAPEPAEAKTEPAPIAGPKHHPLWPPAADREMTTRVSGCLEDVAAGEAGARRYPATARRSGDASPEVTVSALGSGVVVTHRLDHACCLAVELSSSVQGGVVEIVEELSGEPCRCMCSSTLEAAVALSTGAYTLRVITRRDGRDQVAHEGPLAIRALDR